MDYENALSTIVELTDRIADPLERITERRRLMRELYQRQAAEARAEQKSDEDEDADEAEAIGQMADFYMTVEDRDQMVAEARAEVARIAAGMDKLARVLPQDGEAAIALRSSARNIRRHIRERRSPEFARAKTVRPGTGAPRPRGRRERHVARATSSGDSGDDGPGEPPSAAAEVEDWERCAICDSVRRLIIVSASFDETRFYAKVLCTVCWCEVLTAWPRS